MIKRELKPPRSFLRWYVCSSSSALACSSAAAAFSLELSLRVAEMKSSTINFGKKISTGWGHHKIFWMKPNPTSNQLTLCTDIVLISQKLVFPPKSWGRILSVLSINSVDLALKIKDTQSQNRQSTHYSLSSQHQFSYSQVSLYDQAEQIVQKSSQISMQVF